MLLAVLAAGAVTVAAVGRAGPVAGRGGVLGRVRAALFLLAGLVGAGAAVRLPLLSEVGPWGLMPSVRTTLITRFGEVAYGLIIVLLAVAIAGITARVRRRVLTLMLPVAVLLAVAELGSDRAFSGAVPMPAPLGGASEIWWLIGAPRPRSRPGSSSSPSANARNPSPTTWPNSVPCCGRRARVGAGSHGRTEEASGVGGG